MATSRHTLAIIKPDAVEKNRIGLILAHLEERGFRVLELRLVQLETQEAEAFYEVHRERPFYRSLVAFMTSGPCVAMVLERDDAVAVLRETIGATDPSQAALGTVRQRYAESVERNAIHASDSNENARREIDFFFGFGPVAGARRRS